MASGRLTEENCLGQDRNLSYLVNTKIQWILEFMTRSIFSWFSQKNSLNTLIFKKNSIKKNGHFQKSPIHHWYYYPDWMDNNVPEILRDRKLMMSPMIWWPLICWTRGACVTPEAGGGGAHPGVWPQGSPSCDLVTTGDSGARHRTLHRILVTVLSDQEIPSPALSPVSTFLTINPFTKLYCSW